MLKELQPLIDQGLDINAALSESGAAQIQRFDMQAGKVVIVGVQNGGSSVSAATQDAFLQAFQSAGGGPGPVPPGADLVPPGTAGISEPGDELYLALGDSLAANVGVDRPQDGYVSRFHAHLERETGRDLGLLNLGISGESSFSIMQGQFQRALNEIRQRRDDGNPRLTADWWAAQDGVVPGVCLNQRRAIGSLSLSGGNAQCASGASSPP